MYSESFEIDFSLFHKMDFKSHNYSKTILHRMPEYIYLLKSNILFLIPLPNYSISYIIAQSSEFNTSLQIFYIYREKPRLLFINRRGLVLC